MMKPRPFRRRPQPSEEGYILIAVVFLLALLVLAMSIALPNITKQIERDREVETMHRGKQYVRALKLYHKKFGNYPPTVDALINSNQIRFLRKKYIDPSTGKNEWKPIHFGQNKQPTAFGFFGKPMASTMGGMGMGCGNNGLGAGIGSSGSSTSSFGSSSMGSSSFGSNGLNSSMGMGSNSPLGGCQPDASGAASGGSGASGASGNPNDPSNPNGTSGASGNSTDNPGGGNNGNSNNGNNSTGSTDLGSSSGSSSSGSSSGSSLTTSSLGGSSSGLSGQTLGGGGIIGFSPGSPKKTILLYKKQNHFNQWEFVYDPAQDQMLQIGGGSTGLQQSGSMPGSNGIGSPGGFGNSPSGFGNSPGGFGNSPGGFGNTGNTNSGSGSSDSGTSGSGSTSGSSDSGSTYSPAR